MTWQQWAATAGLLAIPWLHGFLGAATHAWDEHHWTRAHLRHTYTGRCSRCSREWPDFPADDIAAVAALARQHNASGECIGAQADRDS